MRYFLYLFLTILFFACCKKKDNIYYNLTADDLTWLVYNKGDTVLFKSNTGKIDTFICTNADVRSYSTTSTEGRCRHKTNYEESWAKIQNISNDTSIEYNSIRIEKSSANLDISIIVDGFIGSGNPYYVPLLPNLVINGTTYTNIYIFSRDTMTYPFSQYPDSMVRFYFNKQRGFLKYEYRYGSYWEINN